MKKCLLYSISLLVICFGKETLNSQPRVQQSVCIDCHLEIDIPEYTDPVHQFQIRENGRFVDIHARAGYGCHDCHGGDPHDIDRAKDPRAGYIGKPSSLDIPQLCADCHSDIEYMRDRNPRLPTDQLRLYRTSDHGKALEQGDLKVATCTSCHGTHTVRRSDDPLSLSFARNVPNMCAQCHSDETYMAEYAIPTDQLDKYRNSEHARLLLEEGDIGAPACNTCHGNHGAAPPRVAAVHQVCGQCHAQHDEYFMQSTHAEIFEMMDMPGCATCHGFHEIPTPSEEMLSNEPGSICMTCHVQDDPCFLYVENIRDQFEETREKLAETEEILKRAELLGMSVAQAQFNLAEVRDHFIRARIRVHQFEPGPVEEELDQAMATIALAYEQGERALREWQTRRVGLAVSLVFIALLVVALIMKIRMREERKGQVK
jgi:predicted CXXCH cytochrome family protein